MNSKISIIIPCYNEQLTVGSVIKKICEEFPNYQIVLVDDGSTDKSIEILRNLNYKNFKLIELEKNYGKGRAMREGLKYIKDKCEVVIFTDADNEIDIMDLHKVVNKYEDPKIMSVFGSRFSKISINTIIKMGIERYIANRIFTFFGNIKYRQKLTDQATAVKSFRSSLIEKLNLNSDGFDIEPEIIKGLYKNKIKISEVSISYNPRSVKEGKKLSYKDGFIYLKELFK
tara:strand:- start:1249 stop:1935 length:687 start_codon:yes stop_codon:yes gene_type:complete